MEPSQKNGGLWDVEVERRRLLGLAYRMLGTISDAEDAVQEAFLRWYRLDEAERATVTNPAGWFTRVASRICLDVLGSARARREKYVGEWLPEPLPSGYLPAARKTPDFGSDREGDPLGRVTLDESVSTALLVVLETMTPAERVAFVLHDIFAFSFEEIGNIVGRSPAAARKLASSARRRIGSERHKPVDRQEHARVLNAFGNACRRGDLQALTGLLDPAVVLRSDGGGVVRAAINPITGPSKVGRFILGVLKKQAGVHVQTITTVEGPALALMHHTAVTGIVNVSVDGGCVLRIWIQWNPEKLSSWPRQTTGTS
ncbi:RNA polymerase sigma factor SigJ [Pseudarthrobacter sp. W1I19]|uniref:RNA polymerase sigma factor SigJ n=1 Tax=Pseudarthrobacter sp. W1I19 TaxID=3042288 RepID=UPI0027D802EF|nr:RNA polymerase sigma factor SigJ [Pseudarthrobacter sp. W1I19]